MRMNELRLDEFADLAMHTDIPAMHELLHVETPAQLLLVLSYTQEQVSVKWVDGVVQVQTEHGRYDFMLDHDCTTMSVFQVM